MDPLKMIISYSKNGDIPASYVSLPECTRVSMEVIVTS